MDFKELKMQITMDIEQDLYEDIKDMGIDIHSKIKEYIKHLRDDSYGYPAISTEEAKKRVADAVESYRRGEGEYLSQEEYEKEMEEFLKTL
jgi:gas vesicle protein